MVIHEREKHVCEKCRLDIPDGELDMEDVLVHHGGRGRSAEYRKAYYHRSCLAEVRREREAAERREAARKASRAKKLSFGWGIAGGIIAFAMALLVFLLVPECKAAIHPALAVLYSVLIGYGIFAMLYCIITGSYIGDVFVWCAKLSIRFPGIIFSWSIEGFAWLIVMKILFAILGFIIGVLALIFAIIVSASLGGISFPFVLIHNIHTNYRDAF